MPRHLVCLTFDFDAMSGFVARGLTTPTPVSRGEFGVVGVERILALLERHGIRATFFVPGVVIETYPQVCRRVVEAGHEIGHHGWTHAPPAQLTREQEEQGLVRGNEAIRALTGRPARGYRSPAWDLSPHTLELLLAQGFVYESSMMGHDYLPYRARVGDRVHADEAMAFGQETALVEMPISWSLDDHPHFEYMRWKGTVMPGLMNARQVMESWLDDFRYMARVQDWGVLTYTCHPYVIGRGHRMLAFEDLVERLVGLGAQFLSLEAAVAEFVEREGQGAG